jgi:hypothetical protein
VSSIPPTLTPRPPRREMGRKRPIQLPRRPEDTSRPEDPIAWLSWSTSGRAARAPHQQMMHHAAPLSSAATRFALSFAMARAGLPAGARIAAGSGATGSGVVARTAARLAAAHARCRMAHRPTALAVVAARFSVRLAPATAAEPPRALEGATVGGRGTSLSVRCASRPRLTCGVCTAAETAERGVVEGCARAAARSVDRDAETHELEQDPRDHAICRHAHWRMPPPAGPDHANGARNPPLARLRSQPPRNLRRSFIARNAEQGARH